MDDKALQAALWYKQLCETNNAVFLPLFFDHHRHLILMGGGTGRKTPEGHLDHGGRWIEAQDWPLPQAEPLVLYPGPDMTLTKTAPGDGCLSYDYDPRDPVPTIGGALTSGEPIFTGGGFDQVEAEGFFGCRNPGMPLIARPCPRMSPLPGWSPCG